MQEVAEEVIELSNLGSILEYSRWALVNIMATLQINMKKGICRRPIIGTIELLTSLETKPENFREMKIRRFNQ